MPHALPLARAERPGLVPDRVRHAEPAEVVHEARRGAACAPPPSDRPSCVAGCARRGRRPRASGRGCTATSGRRSSRSPAAPRRTRSPESTTASAGSASITASQRPDRVEPAEDLLRLGAQERRRVRDRTACRCACGRASSPPRPRRRGARPRRTPPAARSATASGTSVARQLARPALARPTARRRRRAPSSTSSGSPSCSPSARASAACWAIMPSSSRWPESANSRPTRKRCSGGLPAPSSRNPAAVARRPLQLVVVLARLQRDVVAEPLRLLVGVGVAADVDQQRRVVDDRPRLLVEPEPLGEPQRDQALAQHVLHRLPEAEVDPERQRRDELRQANLRTIGVAAHARRVRPNRAKGVATCRAASTRLRAA